MMKLFILQLLVVLPFTFGGKNGEIGQQQTLSGAASPASPPGPPSPSQPPPSPDGGDTGAIAPSDGEVYTIITEIVFKNFSKLVDGVISGFNIDLVEAVCTLAEMDCDVVMDSSDTCVGTDDATGNNRPGLYIRPGSTVAGCVGWSDTIVRRNFARFTTPQTLPDPTFLITQLGQPFGSRPSDGDVVAFNTGFSSDPRCLRQHVTGDFDSLFVEGEEAALDAVRDGSARFAFICSWASFDQSNLQDTGLDATCDGGLTVITPKRGSGEFIGLWNAGFNALSATDYKELCDRWEIDSCLPDKLP